MKNHSHLGVDVSMVIDQKLHDLHQPSLTCHVQRRGELAIGRGGARGAVHVCSRPNEEAGGGFVVEENGLVEEGEVVAIGTLVPGVRITAMDYLEGGET